MRAGLLWRGMVVGLTMAVASPVRAQSSADDLAFFESKVRPLLIDHCYSCHSATASKLKGELRLDSPSAWKKGGASGPALVAGKPDESLIVQAVRRDHKDVAAMPPQKPLTADQIAVLVEWVKRGAPAPAETESKTAAKESIDEAKKRWPFTPVPATVPVPAVQSKAKGLTEIDRFLLAKLEAKKLVPLGEADRKTLIRRVTYDLIGLPPTPEEIDAFAPTSRRTRSRRSSIGCSPRRTTANAGAGTGSTWSATPTPPATTPTSRSRRWYRYRNWVIDAFNRDLPYDQFVREQIAGDLLRRQGRRREARSGSSPPATSPTPGASARAWTITRST